MGFFAASPEIIAEQHYRDKKYIVIDEASIVLKDRPDVDDYIGKLKELERWFSRYQTRLNELESDSGKQTSTPLIWMNAV